MVRSLFKSKQPHIAENYMRNHPHYVVGLDVGQAADYTALAVLERELKNVGQPYVGPELDQSSGTARWVRERQQKVENRYIVRHLDRPPLRTPYTKVVDGVIERIKALCPPHLYDERPRVVLIVDATGVGRGIVDMLYSQITQEAKAEIAKVSLWPATITGGTGRSSSTDGWISLPKTELIHTGGVVPMQAGRLKWGAGVPNRRVLEEELSTYRRNQNIATGNQQFEPWRESEHDDLLFALCLAGWAWRQYDIRYLSLGDPSEIAPETPEPEGRTPMLGEPLPPLP
jgi:hypothetical protein